MTLYPVHVQHVDVTPDLLDQGMAVHHPNHVVLADRARTDAFARLGYALHELGTDGYALMVRSMTTDYLQPIFACARIAVLTEIRRHSARSLHVVQSFAHRHELGASFANGSMVRAIDERATVLCRLEARLVCINTRELRVDAIPARLSDALEHARAAAAEDLMGTWQVGAAA